MKERQVVVSRFNEGLSWVWARRFVTIIYNKGLPLETELEQVCLPNVGRESHSFLWHIVNNYDALADQTIFCQGNPTDHLGQTTIWEMLEAIDGARFVVPRFWTGREFGEDGQLVHWGPWKAKLDSGAMRKSDLSMAEWFTKYVGVDILAIGHLTYTLGANFGVRKDVIHRRPKEFYQAMLETVSGHIDPEESYFVERAWLYVFKLGMPQNFVKENQCVC